MGRRGDRAIQWDYQEAGLELLEKAVEGSALVEFGN
jgi:hypothetical protein